MRGGIVRPRGGVVVGDGRSTNAVAETSDWRWWRPRWRWCQQRMSGGGNVGEQHSTTRSTDLVHLVVVTEQQPKLDGQIICRRTAWPGGCGGDQRQLRVHGQRRIGDVVVVVVMVAWWVGVGATFSAPCEFHAHHVRIVAVEKTSVTSTCESCANRARERWKRSRGRMVTLSVLSKTRTACRQMR